MAHEAILQAFAGFCRLFSRPFPGVGQAQTSFYTLCSSHANEITNEPRISVPRGQIPRRASILHIQVIPPRHDQVRVSVIPSVPRLTSGYPVSNVRQTSIQPNSRHPIIVVAASGDGATCIRTR